MLIVATAGVFGAFINSWWSFKDKNTSALFGWLSSLFFALAALIDYL